MLGYWAEAEQPILPVQRTLQVYFAKHPVIGGINIAAARSAGILGPMFWAALIILFVSGRVVAG